MSIQEKFSDAMERIKSDPNLANEFKEDPVKTAESVLGVDLPDEQVEGFINHIKVNVDLSEIKSPSDLFNSIKHLF